MVHDGRIGLRLHGLHLANGCRLEGVRRAAHLSAKERQRGEGRAPLMPLIIDAVRARASVGEIADALGGVWGRYAPGR